MRFSVIQAIVSLDTFTPIDLLGMRSDLLGHQLRCCQGRHDLSDPRSEPYFRLGTITGSNDSSRLPWDFDLDWAGLNQHGSRSCPVAHINPDRGPHHAARPKCLFRSASNTFLVGLTQRAFRVGRAHAHCL